MYGPPIQAFDYSHTYQSASLNGSAVYNILCYIYTYSTHICNDIARLQYMSSSECHCQVGNETLISQPTHYAVVVFLSIQSIQGRFMCMACLCMEYREIILYLSAFHFQYKY